MERRVQKSYTGYGVAGTGGGWQVTERIKSRGMGEEDHRLERARARGYGPGMDSGGEGQVVTENPRKLSICEAGGLK